MAIDAAGVHFDFTELLGTMPAGPFATATLFIDELTVSPGAVGGHHIGKSPEG